MILPEDVPPSARYRPIAEIGRGGMGEVLLAVAHGVAGFTKLVVLKRARPDLMDEPQVLEMFLNEARLAARLNHPNVVQTYEAGQEAGRYFIAMEYLDGQPLHRIRARVASRWFPLTMQVRILIEALAGLHYAHELADFDGTSLGVIHRDATPQNIFVTYDGQIKVVDFGIAKAANSTVKTGAGILKGKVTYMAPEQARSEALDRRVDIFTVGVMLWEAVTGERMWKSRTNTDILRRLVSGKLPKLPVEAQKAEPDLVRICERAIAPAPADRYANAAELQHELERWLARKGEEMPARSVGAFVAAHFEEERAAIKTLLEQELKDYSSTTRPKVSEAEPDRADLDETVIDSAASTRRPRSTRNPATAGAVKTPPSPASVQKPLAPASVRTPQAAPASARTPQTAALAADSAGSPSAARPPSASSSGDSISLDITVTKRSSLPTVDLGNPSPPGSNGARSAQAAPDSPRALNKDDLPPAPPHTKRETLGESSLSLDTPLELGPRARPRGRRWGALVVGGVILIPSAVVVASLVFRLPVPGIDSLRASLGWPAASDFASGAGVRAPSAAVNVSIRVSPATARIFLDGVLVGTGVYKDKLPKDGRDHIIRAEAPNFVTTEQAISVDADVIVSLALEKASTDSR